VLIPILRGEKEKTRRQKRLWDKLLAKFIENLLLPMESGFNNWFWGKILG
jgi:hypothetical protein